MPLRRAGGQPFTVLPVFALLSGAAVGLGLALAWSRTSGGLTRMPCEFGGFFPHCTSLRPAPGGLAFSRWRALGSQALPRHLAGELLATAARARPGSVSRRAGSPSKNILNKMM